MITIGIDASRANLVQRTGTEWYAWQVIQAFKALIPVDGYRVILYVKEPLVDDLLPLPAHWEVKVLRWPPRLLWTQLRLSLHFMVPGRRPDVLYIPAHTIPIIHPHHVVYVAHDLGFERQPDLYNTTYIGGRAMNFLIRLLTFGRYSTSEQDYHRWSMRFAARHAQRIITISQFTAQELTNIYSVPQGKVTVIYNGYNAPSAAASESLSDPARDCILYVGRIEHKKNLLNLVEAYVELRKILPACPPLYCIGRPGYGADEITKKITELHLEEYVTLVGYVSTAELQRYWQRAKVFVLPSQYEGFGIPVLEAMAQRVTVACSDLPPLREIGQEYCFYFDPHDPKGIAQTLQTAWQQPEAERAAQRERAYAHVQQFSWQRCAAQTWQVLQQEVD